MMGTWKHIIAAVVLATVSCSGENEPSNANAPAPPLPSPPAGDTQPGSSSEPGTAGPVTPEAQPAADVPVGGCAGPAGKRLRTLIVGNSQIYYWDLPKLLSDISESAPPACPRVDAEGFTRGGQNLKRLWNGGDSKGRTLAPMIATGAYDVVVIAESIDLVEPNKPPEEFTDYANLIIDAARAAGALPILYATPYARQEGHRGFVEMATPQLALGAKRSVKVATGGLAWLRVWELLPTIDLHHTDRAHPGHKGSYVSAMVIYATITGATPVGLTSAPPFECGNHSCAPITPTEAPIFQWAAWTEARTTALQQ